MSSFALPTFTEAEWVQLAPGDTFAVETVHQVVSHDTGTRLLTTQTQDGQIHQFAYDGPSTPVLANAVPTGATLTRLREVGPAI